MTKSAQQLTVTKKEGKDTRTFTFKFNTDIIRSLKMLALEKNTTATALLEEAVIRLLKENKKL
ncbi:MAG: hypothetical protein DLM72_10135 [Candidatus Nitrosopolaris wilkensis]|nr:MAG: hypothetical protein DLM72_10135 [Candidatus Nitrosopolaris wilkensis]